MHGKVVVISGPVGSGKSSLSRCLKESYGFEVLHTRDVLKRLHPRLKSRREFQRAGEKLDRDTGGSWVAQELRDIKPETDIAIDAVRIKDQIDAIRKAFGRRVTHVHLEAPPAVLAARHSLRDGAMVEPKSYATIRRNPTEQGVAQLADEADVLIETSRCSADDVLVRVASRLGLYGRGIDRLVDVLVGGQFGSEGKGHVASYLAPEYDVLVRVGGPNAGHKVYEGKKDPTTFHHLPSGTRRAPQAMVLLGPGAVIGLDGLLAEIARAELRFDRLAIDPQAMVIEQEDVAFEAAGLVGAIGSTGQGVGAATARKILRTAATPVVRLAREIPDLKPYVRSTTEVLERAFANGGKVLLEGTQGTGLSVHHGYYPYVTSRETTVAGCLADAGIAPSRVRKIVMVCRTYPIRVESPKGGTSGPMAAAELTWQQVADRSRISIDELVEKEKTSTTYKSRRVAEFSWHILRRSASLNGPTDVALSFADYLTIDNRKARRFDQLTADTIRFVEEVECVAGAPVSLITTRFHYRSIIDRRAW